MATVKPFDAGDWFPIHNAVFDAIMPILSPDAWKALCVAIRQTWGPTDANGDPTERQKWSCLSDSQFQDRMGCESRATVSMALRECVEAGYLVRYEIKEEQAKPIYVYALNRDLQFEVVDSSELAGTETGLVHQKEITEDGDDDMSLVDQFLMSTWRFANNGDEITDDGLDVLWKLLGSGLAINALVDDILTVGSRLGNVTIELVEAVVTGRMSIPLLGEDLEESSPPPEPPHGPVMATTSTTETDPLLAEVTRMYEDEIGLVTGRTREHLLALTEEHRDMDKWRKAFDAVVRSNIRRLDYLTTCLENVGKPKSKKPGQRGRGRRQRQESTVKEKPPAEDLDPETQARQRAALAELKRKQRKREQK